MYTTEEIRNELLVAISQFRSELTGLAPVCQNYAETDVARILAEIATVLGIPQETVQIAFDYASRFPDMPSPGASSTYPDVALWFMPSEAGLPKLFIGTPIPAQTRA